MRWSRDDPAPGPSAVGPSVSFDSTANRSGEDFLDLVKNTYRVLLTRRLMGCYVYFLDRATRDFVRSRIE